MEKLIRVLGCLLFCIHVSIAIQAQADSNGFRDKLDSIGIQMNDLKSIVNSNSDSIGNKVDAPFDSLNNAVAVSKQRVQQQIDSLKTQGLAFNKQQETLDSINGLLALPGVSYSKAQEAEANFRGELKEKIPGYDSLSKINGTVERATTEVTSVSNDLGISNLGGELNPDLQTDLDKSLLPQQPDLNNSLNEVRKPDIDIKSPDMQMPNADLPNASGVDMVKEKAGTVTEKGADVLSQGQGVANEVGEYANEVKSVREDGIGRSEKIDELAEEQVSKIDGVTELQTQEGELNPLTNFSEPIKSEEELEKELIEKTKELATDIVIAQQPKVNADIKKLSKYKRKFDNVPDIRSLPERAPNPLKELHWRERVVPGIVTQAMNLDKFYFQIDPHVYYRISQTFSAGFGGMYRFSLNPAKVKFSNFGILTGQKMFVHAHVFKGFFIVAEGQRVNWKSVDPMRTDPIVWDDGIVAAGGIGKRYQIGKRIQGNAQTLYHWYWGEYDPYKTRIMLRIGIDFSIKKREKKSWEQKLKTLRKKVNTTDQQIE